MVDVNNLTDVLNMKILKQYWIAILIIIVTVALIGVKSLTHNNFRYDAVRHAVPSVSGENLLTAEQLGKLEGEKLIINLDGERRIDNQNYRQISISPDSLLSGPNKTLIFKHKGITVLSSTDKSETAAAWMVLSQMGLKRVYILNN